MKLETLAVLAGIAASVTAVLAYLHARNNSTAQQMARADTLRLESRIITLERKAGL